VARKSRALVGVKDEDELAALGRTRVRASEVPVVEVPPPDPEAKVVVVEARVPGVPSYGLAPSAGWRVRFTTVPKANIATSRATNMVKTKRARTGVNRRRLR
jgi:hypothetical protein